ncbi:MAG: hypothetical protein JWL77_1221 [Chthonomonadaceae bacterium]|nr:hypothetical protein [Chthonomonadaceae bacterium]
MNRRYVWLGTLLACGLAGATVAAKPPAGPLVVHEWGTFLSMNGSDGVTLDGMYHEEHALPDFVHARSRDQLHIRASDLKGETPVIYFYTRQPQQISLRVNFPQGVWTQWYPQAEKVGPSWEQSGSPLEPRHGHITWDVQILPVAEGRKAPDLPKTDSEALWNYARDVDAAYVRTIDTTHGTRPETERFLFYRGLGQAKMPLGLAYAEGGTLTLPADARFSLKHLFVLRVEKGRAAYRYLPELRPGDRLTHILPVEAGMQPISDVTAQISDDLANRLTQSGLFPKEARAMVNTWRRSYFESDGIRVLYILPQSWTEGFLPMTLSPTPETLVRVMVGRTELLTPEREAQAAAAVRDLASAETARREKAFDWLRDQGRYVEPILRQVLRTHPDARTETLCRRLLLTDFSTTLRAASRSASGAPVVEAPYTIHSQLAVVLREMGLNAEAKQEADTVLAALRQQPNPRMNESEARHYLRAYARAMEGTGDDRAAAQGYGKFITFASQITTGCNGCHSGVTAPKDMFWFRDWYAGRRFADCVLRTGSAEAEITAQKAAVEADAGNAAAQMKLAYLYEAQGKHARAEAIWTDLQALRPQTTAHTVLH